VDVTWSNYVGSLSGALAVGMTVSGLILKGWLVGKVVAPARVDELEKRVDAVEELAEAAASHKDLVETQQTLGDVRVMMAGVQAKTEATHDAVGRVEHLVNLLVENGLRERVNAG
jgi:hypothetical protein